MKSENEIIIIGGGIIGLACAHYLIKKNASVRIIEQDFVGAGASHGNCGLLHYSGIIPLCAPGVVTHEILRTVFKDSPLYIKPTLDIKLIHWLLKFAAHCNLTHMNAASMAKNDMIRYSLDLFDTLFCEHTLTCDLEKKGVLLLFKDKKYLDKYESVNAFLNRYNLGSRNLSMEEAMRLEPAIRSDLAGVRHNPNDWHLRPETLMEAWKNLLIKKGVVIEEGCKMIDFGIRQNKIRSVNTTLGQYTADNFILTTGAWTSQMNQQLRLNIPIQPGKGYSITMKKPDQSPEIPCFLYERNMVVTPWKTGYRLGGTMEFSGFDDHLNKKRLSKLITGSREYLKTDVSRSPLEEWAGFRPMTYDDLPVIDRSPVHGNLFVATGHAMLGLTMATGTGKAVCDMIYDGKAQIDLAPFSIDRF